MDDLYREHILDHYKNPRNHGTIEDADVSAEGVNPLCGDQLAIDLKIADGRIEDIKFHGRGCSISQAATSMLTELAEGRPSRRRPRCRRTTSSRSSASRSRQCA